MGGWRDDIRTSLRQLAKAPGFTGAAILVLTLGIGLNAAMFGLVHAFAYMGRPFAVRVQFAPLYSSQVDRPDSYPPFSPAAWRELADGSDVFAGVLAHTPTVVGIGDGAEARRSFVALVSRNYFEVLGVPIVRGRGFTADEARPGADLPVAIASWSYWQRHGFADEVVGSTVRVNERPFTIVGVTPRGFSGTMMVFGPELFFPLGVFDSLANDLDTELRRSLAGPEAYNLFLVGRLRAGVSAEVASSHLPTLAGRLERAYPAAYRDARLTLAPLPRFGTSTSPMDESVIGLLGAVMLGLTAAVLLTVCLNLASMLLARGRARRKEFAIRLAIGGQRWRIVRQLLVEGGLLALAGGAGGLALGLYGIDALVAAFSSRLPITIIMEDGVSVPIVAATLAFCLLATAWFALGPALRHSRADVLADLKPQAGEEVPSRRRRFVPRHPLVVGQVALSLALLVGAGLFIRMAEAGMSVDFGFDAADTVLVEIDTSLAGMTPERTVEAYAGLQRALLARPGVETAAVGALVPLGMVHISRDVRRAGPALPEGATPATAAEGRAFNAPWNAVSGTYFRAMGCAIEGGRSPTPSRSPPADRRWPSSTRRWRRASGPRRRARPAGAVRGPVRRHASGDADAVVGIVSSARRELFEKEMPGAIYVPFAQGRRATPAARAPGDGRARPPATPAAPSAPRRRPAAVQQPHAERAPHAVHGSGPWAGIVAAGGVRRHGVLVALVGIYGVMSYAVARRTREIGIRVAVGARPGAVRGMILSESLRTTLLGLAGGWVLALGLGRLLASIFVDLAAFDVATFTVVPLAFLAAALVAAWLPARRATTINPMSALRSE